jgi:hypothetical protein
VIALPPIHLGPDHALAYLRELQPGAREVALVGPGGALAAGAEGEPARVARELQRGGGRRARAGALLAVRVGDRAIAAFLPDAGGALAEYDLRCAASATAVTVPG